MFENNIYALLLLSISFFSTMVYLDFQSNKIRRKKYFELSNLKQKILIFSAVIPLIISTAMPQYKIGFKINYVRYLIGILFVIVALVMYRGAFLKIGSVPGMKRNTNLIINGIYGVIRHPIYSANLHAFLGTIILFNALVSLIYIPIFTVLYYFIIKYEEENLIEEYGHEYMEYISKVNKKIIPYVI